MYPTLVLITRATTWKNGGTASLIHLTGETCVETKKDIKFCL